ncbi:ALG6, ALG8 glycosyltransferase family-domain-containing protein [Multifurca ochricompacta]|uniref:Alpha-1,3-glucosyltransferase n=1 Tax=Multifurca ochricompacta TaxID=376703 RepID=A0AAD4M8D4_9AGAM|nr:ALG6, ALG8 glycosyltransferase family-domain-containing protein [Multifurca ochricompacta]
MDGVETNTSLPQTPRRRPRIRTTSISSQPTLRSDGSLKTGNRPPSPVVRPLSSNPSDSYLEIVAPVPRKHRALQPTPDAWIRTPSPSSTRAISPSSPTSGSLTRGYHSYSSFSAVMEAEKETLLQEQGFGRQWLRWMHKNGIKHWVLPCTLLASALVRWCIGLGSYSGQGTPPMFGDYEAQRHWMELTNHLSVREWYSYDLQYWGLDYPPLTAYHSWLCGKIGSFIDSRWFAFDTSRGIETPASKVFLRSTVILSDYAIYVPAALLFTRIWHSGRSRRTQNAALLTLLFQPALLLIDFGHFQYNSVMLGFTLLAATSFITGNDVLGAFLFTLSLGFKQMALYYAPAIGSYLIGKCLYLGPRNGTQLFFRLAAVTTGTFILLFLPFLPPFSPISKVLDPVMRIFPFNRGIFEDKVANFWCATNVVVKWKIWASQSALMRLSSLLTFLGFLGAAIAPIRAWLRLRNEDRATRVPSVMQTVLLLALLNSSMSFFLFSFQVHEKTILLPLLPLTLLLSTAPHDSPTFKLGVLANNVGVFSMWPLLRKDGLAIQYIALTLLWNRLIGHAPFVAWRSASFLDMLTWIVYLGCTLLHLLEFVYRPPARYPDLFVVLNVLLSTPVFFFTWLWSIKSIIEARWTVGGLSVGKPKEKKADLAFPTESADGVSSALAPSSGVHNRREGGMRAQSLGYAAGKRQTGWRATATIGLG